MKPFRENHEPCYPAHYQLMLLMDLLDAQGIHHHQYLKGTGLFYEDIVRGNKIINAQQFIKLIDNAQTLGDPSLSFRWGHVLWPGHYDVYSQLINNTETLLELINVLHQYSEMLCPLLKPIIINGNNYSFLYWQDEIGTSHVQRFLVETYTTALLSLSHWFSHKKLPWRLIFSHREPAYIEEYVVNLGDNVQFNMGVNSLALNHDHMQLSWDKPTGSTAIKNLLSHQADEQYDEINPGLIGVLTQWNQNNIHKNPNLEQTANAFNMSSATLKRKLKMHGTSFQKNQDQARLSICLYLLHHKKLSNQQVSDYLKFSDANNFRKAFRRWCGTTPNDMREKLAFKVKAI